jgi:hypothetical protein
MPTKLNEYLTPPVVIKLVFVYIVFKEVSKS